jgi:hypothetical protein
MGISPPVGIRRRGDGKFTVRLPAHERTVLVSLPAQVLALARGGDASTARLFPPAYLDDLDAEADYVAMARPELMDNCADALETFRRTINNEVLSEDEAERWLTALNHIRLVVGTKIDVQEGEAYPDPAAISADDIRSQGLLLYGYLTWLQSELVAALSPGTRS